MGNSEEGDTALIFETMSENWQPLGTSLFGGIQV